VTSCFGIRTDLKPQLLKNAAGVLLVCGSALLSGCGGGGAKTVYQHRMTTVGQELTDLKKAHEQGALSDREYERQRQRLLEGEDD
jgi:hypothetical protein